MILLKPQQAKSLISQQEKEAALQKQRLNNDLIEEYAKSKRIKEELEMEAKKITEEFNAYSENIKIKKATLKSEFDILEKRRQEALKPINAELDLLEKRKITIDAERKFVDNIKHENQLILDKKEKNISEIKTQREKMGKQEITIAEKIKELNILSASMSLETGKLEADKNKFDAFLKKQTKILNYRDEKLKLSEEKVEIDKRIIGDREIEIEKEKVKLTRQQKNLKIAFDEAKTKNLL